MSVLVTGATGFIGGHLAARLAGDGVPVRALVRPGTDSAHLESLGVQVHRGDLEDPRSLDGLVEGCDVIYHLAAARGTGGVGHSGRRETDVHGTELLARLTASQGARFVFSSSRGVHGPRGGMLTEDTPPAPNTAYRRAKREAELRLAELREETGLRLVILRVPSVIGPGGRSWLDLFRAVGAGGFRIIGAGRNPIHPCPVEDVVSAMRLAGDSQGCEGETYIFSGRESMLLGAFLAAIGRAVGVPLSRVRLPAAPYRALLALRRAVDRAGGRAAELSAYEMFLSGYEIDNARARRDLGYEPTHSLEDSISATAAWYRAEGLL